MFEQRQRRSIAAQGEVLNDGAEGAVALAAFEPLFSTRGTSRMTELAQDVLVA